MKILTIVDFKGWAISKLADIVVRHNRHFSFKVLEVHPKEVQKSVELVKQWIDWADVIQMEYWNTALQLVEFIPELKKKKMILMHHNQKNLLSGDWGCYKTILCHTIKAKTILAEAGYKNVKIVPYGLDLEYFKFNESYPPKEKLVGYCGRIVPWKNLKEIAQACYELGYKLLVMGKPDKINYWESIPIEHRENMDLSFINAEDEERLDFYNSLQVFVQYSSDGREEGTLPLLEAMASGVPVVTSPAGTAADIIEDHVNGIMTPFDNYEALKANIKELMEDEELRQDVRREAWNTIKNFPEARMAREYEKIFHQVYDPVNPLVSVVIPTYNAKDNVLKILNRLTEMDWPHLEVLICDDGSDDATFVDVKRFQDEHEGMTIKYFYTGNDLNYGLAKARNIGAVEAAGEYLMFLDSRILPEKDAINQFVKALDGKTKNWVFGDKGGQKTTFVENFSMIRRDEFIKAGMSCERIEQYGGMSQELRERFQSQGFKFQYIAEAKATQLSGSKMTAKRRQDIIKSKLLLYKMGL